MTLNNERLFDNIEICYLILNVFLENDQLYQYYKKEVLTYIFNILNGEYDKIEEVYKAEFFNQVQNVYMDFIKDYGLYDDILENINPNILNKFKFNEIVENINGR